ncbi:two-component system response regulator NarL [Erwinia sp. OLTSP20]|uniref:two-component system response regulator NarL n=1 Tax=unclassified Erwinia TaxID=2622719 RepID=UPI000C197D05|nr:MULTISPECIES: two-component system response regulator NarL [unclassified Erwinia]PIJ49533.1 two-component system response regulator NarL [Erwinia sp. OAMSP11]PIJ71199.1 two-component system response regulator NarL [Erwinia sp. OLSSP12]PIJ79848.1 two-component system response regulator NarL [Erwinia sp. OLCASP19]PIJ81611.1 two-component system response regulator NarL [Erwinia sp. OLMTSP26]PIJ84026.1 two-component system response regulator NarL [Erwinia sp. OLMDSP33]
MTMTPATLLLIDDHPTLRRGICQLVSLDPMLKVIAEAGSGPAGVALAREHDPDLILLDMNMPGCDGLATLHALRQQPLSSRIVIFTVSDAQQDVVAALRQGAEGYLLKDMEPEALLAALHQAAAGEMVLSDNLAPLLAEQLRAPQVPANLALSALTPRETEILHQLSRGLSNKLIARELDISESTVKVHVKHLLQKLSLRSRTEAAIWLLQQKK